MTEGRDRERGTQEEGTECHRQPGSFGSESGTHNTKECHTRKGWFVLLFDGYRENARQHKAAHCDDADDDNDRPYHRPRPRCMGCASSLTFTYERDEQ